MTRESDAPRPVAPFLEGGGEMGERMRALDWSKGPLGPVDQWPRSLTSALSMLLPSKAQIILFWGPEYVVFYNDAYRSVFGAKHPEMLGQPGRVAWSEIWETRANLHALLDGVVRTGEAFAGQDLQFVLERHGFAEETYFDVSYDPLRIESGEVGGVYCIVSETTGRVVGERRLALLRDLAARNATARTAREACALAIETIAAHPHDVPFAFAWLDGELQACTPGAADALASADKALVKEIPLAVPGGRLVAGLNSRLPFDEQYRGFLDLVADQLATAIANARAYEVERARAEALAEIDRAKTAFFSNVSHEFRTPLTLMLGPLADLQTHDLSAESRAALDVVGRNGHRLLKLVNTLLDFARIEAGRAQATYAATDLAAFTASLASGFRSAIEKAGLAFTIDCPPLGEPAYIDREMWEQIVLNLLSNAFKFTYEGEIAVTLRRGDDHFRLDVRDTGVGIAAAELPRVFERFHRVEGARGRSHEGSGIGLALVQEIVKLHGGTVAVESSEGRGSTFAVSIRAGTEHLPAERIDGGAALAATGLGAEAYVQEALGWLPGVATSSSDTARTESARILWADDNADMRDYVRRLLAEQYDVEAVADGEAALAAARRRRPHLIVSDVMMPRLDGFGLLSALRADPALREVPVLLLSARAGEEARLEGLGKGADDYLVKPFSARELLARVGALLRSVEIRREAEQARRESMDAAPAMLWVTGADGLGTFRSRGWYEFTGQTETEALGMGWLDALHPEDRAGAQAALLDANRDRKPYSSEYRLRRTDGAYRWAIDTGRPHVATDGGFLGFVGSVIDAHERRAAAEALRESEERFRALTSATSDVVYSMSPDWTEMRHLVGREFIDDTFEPRRSWIDQYILPEDQPRVLRVIEDAVRTKSIFALEHRVIRADGTPGWTYSRAVPILDADGAIVEWFGAATDVTRRKEGEEALENADRQKDEFIATLSHELRNPLAPLRNALALWRLGESGRARTAALQEMMERQVDHLVRLVDDLLEMSRITRGTLELRREPLDLRQVVRHAVESTKGAVEAAAHRLSLSLPEGPLALEGDPVRLGQILVNLLNNAARHTGRGSRITVEARREGPRAAVSVRDDGPGLAPEQLGRIFEMFSRGGGSAASAQGGLGIGLAVSRRLAEMHGGMLEAASDGPGHGATFTLYVPLSEARSVPSRDGGRPRAATAARQRVLVVDDNRDAAQTLAALVQRLGSEVELAYDGADALAVFERFRPRAVLLDIGMPGMDGYEVARRMRQHANGTPVTLIAVTGWGQQRDRALARNAGFDDHLVKPAELTVLQSLLGALR